MMHRTEGLNYATDDMGRRIFARGSRVTAGWLNAVQEEIAGLIEGAGLVLEDAIEESQQQLLRAIKNMGQISSIASGTKMLIHADVAPIGWTLIDTLNDYAVIVTKGSVALGETGGAALPTGTWQQDDYALLLADIPAHSHSAPFAWQTVSIAAWGLMPNHLLAGATNTEAIGGDAAHNHGDAWRPASKCYIICSRDAL